MGDRLETPVALLIFNRPETTARVFDAIRRVKPSRLLVVADGPRDGVPGEPEECAEARAVTEQVDWPCEVGREYASANLGCKVRVSSGLDWVFETVEEAIMLEDDCLPNQSFFSYCESLLERYRDDERVMHISGDNFQFGQRRGDASYYFSRYPHVWGWASWRRAWRHYDVAMPGWKRRRVRRRVLGKLTDPQERAFWTAAWDGIRSGSVDTWDFQWVFACMARNGLSAVPSQNLVSNIGFGEGSTHTPERSRVAEMAVADLPAPLTHPQSVEPNLEADEASARLFFQRGGQSAA